MNRRSSEVKPESASRVRVGCWKAGERTYRIVKIPGSNRLLYGCDIRRVRIAFNHNLDSFTEPGQLISNVSRSAQTLELQELFVAELLRVICLGPSFPNVEKSKVVPPAPDKILTGLVGVKFFVLRAIEEGRGF